MGYKIMKKKQISLILAVLILGLSGCSSKETSEPIQETIEIESSSEIESSVIEEPTESSEPETESEEETIEVETTEEITSEIESIEETTEVITEESPFDGVSESEPVQTVESVVEPVQSETPVVDVPVSEPVEIQSQAAEIPVETQTQPAQSTTPTQNADGTISAYDSVHNRPITLTPNGKGWYTDQYGYDRDANGNRVSTIDGSPYSDNTVTIDKLPGWDIDTNNTSTGLKAY